MYCKQLTSVSNYRGKLATVVETEMVSGLPKFGIEIANYGRLIGRLESVGPKLRRS